MFRSSFPAARYMTARGCFPPSRAAGRPKSSRPFGGIPGGGAPRMSLAVELDDELLLDRRVDDLPGREGVHEDAQPGRDDLEPRRHRPGAGLGLRDHERGQLARLLT